MKKNLALCMMLLAAVMMTGCSSDENELASINKSVAGYWQLVGSYQFSDPVPISSIQVTEFRTDGTLIFYEDGQQTNQLPYWIKPSEDGSRNYLYYNDFEDYEDSTGGITISVDGDFMKIYSYSCFYTQTDIYHRISSLEDVEKGEVDEGLISRLGNNEPEFSFQDFQTIQQNEEESTNGTWIIRKVNGILSQIIFFTEGLDLAPSPASPQTEEEFLSAFLPVTADNRMEFYDRDYRDDPSYRQFYKGIPVEQGHWHITFLNGMMQGGSGNFIPIDNLNVYPAVNYATAKKIIENYIHDSVEGESKRFYLSIMSFPENGELKPRLVYVYKRQVWGEGEFVYVDAQTGRLLYYLGYEGGSPSLLIKHNMHALQAPVGRFYMTLQFV